MPLSFRSPAPSDSAFLGTVLPPEEAMSGIVLDIPADARVAESVDCVITGSTHICVRAGARSEVTVYVELKGDRSTRFNIEIILEDEATLNVLCLQAMPDNATVYIRQRTKIGNGATLTLQNVTLGGKEVTHDLVSGIVGDNASSSVDWMFYGKGTERQALFARNVFGGKNGAGEILMKGVAQDKAHVTANGLIEIELKGGGTNTYLTQDVLMLDATAKVDAIPGLEIKTNDVKASHSATVSRVTAEDLFYFAARGIPREEAKKMYVLGFLGDLTGRIRSEELRAKILGGIEEKYAAA